MYVYVQSDFLGFYSICVELWLWWFYCVITSYSVDVFCVMITCQIHMTTCHWRVHCYSNQHHQSLRRPIVTASEVVGRQREAYRPFYDCFGLNHVFDFLCVFFVCCFFAASFCFKSRLRRWTTFGYFATPHGITHTHNSRIICDWGPTHTTTNIWWGWLKRWYSPYSRVIILWRWREISFFEVLSYLYNNFRRLFFVYCFYFVVFTQSTFIIIGGGVDTAYLYDDEENLKRFCRKILLLTLFFLVIFRCVVFCCLNLVDCRDKPAFVLSYYPTTVVVNKLIFLWITRFL